jgi:hypothetical protein
MSWYAVDALDEAFAETRDLLLPFELGTWLRLAVITAFAGLSAPQTPTFSVDAPPEVVVEVSQEFTFAEAIRELPQAVETTVACQNPYTAEWVETERFNALVEPSRAQEQATEGEAETDSLFHIPTDSYSIINPVDVYGPLEEVLREETIDGTPLGDVMFGEIRRYRGSGEVHMDIMFNGLEVRLPGRSDPITMGVTSGYDFFGEHAVYVEGFA